MALNFDSAGSNRNVNHGSAASLDNLAGAGAVSVAAWLYRTTNGDNQNIVYKGSLLCVVTNAVAEGGLQFAFLRATTATNFVTNAAILPLNTWKFVVCTFDDAAGTEVAIYHGDLTTAMAAASFSTSTNGSGAVNSDAANDLIVGNDSGLVSPLRGRCDAVGVWNTALTLAQAETLRNLAPSDWDTVTGCKLASDYHATGTQPDYSGNSNTGTITGATLAAAGIGVLAAADPDDTAWFFSPYNWYSDGAGALSSNNIKASSTFAWTNTAGAYCKFKVVVGSDADASGNVSLRMDRSMLSATVAQNPSIGVSVNNGPLTLSTLVVSTDTNVRQSLVTGLAAGTHEIKVWFKALDLNTTGDRWSTPTRIVKVWGIEADYSATLSLPTLGTKKLLVFGDSQFEGADAIGTGLLVADTDATQTMGILFAQAFDAEYGIVSFGGIGWSRGIGNVVASSSAPSFYNATDANEAWHRYASGKSRLVTGAFSPVPDYIVTDLGGNDSSPAQADITACLDEWRTAAGTSCWIFGVPPLAQQNVATITAAFAGVADTAKTKYLTPALTITISTASLWSNDAGAGSQHLNVRGHARWAAETIKLAQAQLLAGGGGLLTHPGMSGGMRG